MRVALFGCGYKASVILEKLIELKQDIVGVVTDRGDKHESIEWYTKIRALAIKDGVFPMGQWDTVEFHNDNHKTINFLEKCNPDVVFVVGWRYKIPQEQYSIPPKGTIVFHDSLLPKYRGFAPMNWAIINGETKTGATMFYISEGVDEGDIIDQREFEVFPLDDAKSIEWNMRKHYVAMLEKNLPLIKNGEVKSYAQNHALATYTCKRVPDDGLIDWGKTSSQIYNLIRGVTYPYPGAFSYLHDDKSPRKLYIWKASLDTECKVYMGRVQGRIVDIIKGKGVRILTGYGTLIIEQVGFSYGQKLQADEVIKSVKTTLSSIDK